MSDEFMVTMSDVESKPYKPTKHTPENWRVKTKKEQNVSEFGMPVAQTIGGNYFIGNLMDWGSFDEKANADRIVSCINNCAGINPEAVPDVVAALLEAVNWAEGYAQGGVIPEYLKAAHTALAKLEE